MVMKTIPDPKKISEVDVANVTYDIGNNFIDLVFSSYTIQILFASIMYDDII